MITYRFKFQFKNANGEIKESTKDIKEQSLYDALQVFTKYVEESNFKGVWMLDIR